MEDADFVFKTSDSEVVRFIGGVRTLDWQRNRAREIIEHQQIHGFARWFVVLKSTDEQIGRCGPMFNEIEGVSKGNLDTPSSGILRKRLRNGVGKGGAGILLSFGVPAAGRCDH